MIKKIPPCTEKQLVGVKHTAKIIDFGLSLVISTAFNEVYTAHMMLRERRDLYRREIKMFANQTLERLGKQRREMMNLMSDREFFDAYSDHAIDLAENDVTLLRIGVKQVLDDENIPNAEILSYMIVSRALLEMSVVWFKDIITNAKKDYGEYRWEYVFNEFDCSNVLKYWDMVCMRLYVTDKNIDLNTERCSQLCKNLYMKFRDGVYIHACMKEANEERPEFLKKQN